MIYFWPIILILIGVVSIGVILKKKRNWLWWLTTLAMAIIISMGEVTGLGLTLSIPAHCSTSTIHTKYEHEIIAQKRNTSELHKLSGDLCLSQSEKNTMKKTYQNKLHNNSYQITSLKEAYRFKSHPIKDGSYYNYYFCNNDI